MVKKSDKDKFPLDSGANCHIFCRLYWFSVLKTYSGAVTVVSKQSILNIEGINTVSDQLSGI